MFVTDSSSDRLLQDADVAWERGNFQECIEALQRASRLAPSDTRILLRLGHIFGLRYNYTAAERCFESALRIAPQKIEMLTAIAEHCRDFRDPKLAEGYLKKTLSALEQTKFWPPVCIELAKIYERTRRLPEAAQLVDRVLAAAPAYPAALLMRARLERMSGRLEAAEQVLRSFITKPIPLVWTHAYRLMSMNWPPVLQPLRENTTTP